MISRNSCSSNRQKNDYRPLQQLYKTVYSPIYGNDFSRINFACIYRPSERYNTTNMTYGSFHYDNWAFIQKNRTVNYDREHLVQRRDNKNKQQKKNAKKGYSMRTFGSSETADK